MSGGIIRFITPADVRDLKIRLDPSVRALDDTVTSCSKLSDGTRRAWQAFSKAWRTYFDEEDSWLHAAAQHDTGEAYEKSIGDWQRIIGGACPVPGPKIEPPSSPSSELQGTIRTVAVAGVIITVLVTIRSVLR